MRTTDFLKLSLCCASLSMAVPGVNTYFAGDSTTVVKIEGTKTNGGQTGLEVRLESSSYGTSGVIGSGTSIGVQAIANTGSTSDVKRGLYGRGQNTTNSSFGAYLDAYDGSNNYAVAGLSWGGSSVGYGVYGSQSGGSGTGYGVYGTGGNYAGYFNGNVVVTGTFSNPSDLGLKKDVRAIDGGLAKIMALKPKSYRMETAKYPNVKLSEGLRFGLIAQEVENAIPELVTQIVAPPMLSEKGTQVGEKVTLKSVDYMSLIPILVKGMQEQQAEIASLKATIQRLEAR